MKKRKWLSIVLALVLVLPCILTGSGIEPAEDTYSYAIASRPFLADSFEELREASDVMLIGQVVSQYPEQRHDMVFTYSRVQVSEVVEGNLVGSSNLVEVLQTGGTLNGTSTPALADEPLMTVGENYLLCLSYSPADGQYPAYYLPTGGGQGILSFVAMASTELSAGQMSGTASGLDQVLARAESVFDNGSYGCCQPMGGTYGDELTNGHWEKSAISFGLPGTGTSVISGYATSAITSWNANDYVSYVALSGSSALPDVRVYPDYYGNVEWEALTTYSLNGTKFSDERDYYSGIYKAVNINANLSMYDQNNSIWREIICHEAGHALGLGHVNPLDGTAQSRSVMVASTASRVATAPSSYDIELVNEVYERYY